MRFYYLLFILLSCQYTEAQHNYNSMRVSSADVPPDVLETFHNNYPHSEVKQWEKLTRTYNNLTYNKYVAMMVEEGLITRARIKENGLPLTATTYFRGKHRNKLPSNIIRYAEDNFSDLKLVEVEKILLFDDNSTYYRLFLQKGVDYKFIYINLAGTQLDEATIPIKVKEDDAWADK